MNQDTWTRVDRYFESRVLHPDPALAGALEASAAAQLPEIQVSPLQGRMLHVLARAVAARRILEIGTLGGYSTIELARALPNGGQLITLEYESRHVEVARANLQRAGVDAKVDVRLGPALESLPRLVAERAGPFDLIFIDAMKAEYAEYFDWALQLARPGTLIIADNVVRKGAVADAETEDRNVQGIRRFLERVAAEPRVTATALQNVGSKGYDGFALLVVERL